MANQATSLSPRSAAINSQLLQDIKAILIERPTYGYRRVTAILNAKRYKQGVSLVNHKRIYR